MYDFLILKFKERNKEEFADKVFLEYIFKCNHWVICERYGPGKALFTPELWEQVLGQRANGWWDQKWSRRKVKGQVLVKTSAAKHFAK